MRHCLAASAALGLGSLSLVGCARPAASTVDASAPSHAPSVGAALRADPRFSDFVSIIDFAGLGYSLNDASNVTIFAPTNAAFDHSDPSWRGRTSPAGTSNFDASNSARQDLIKQTVLMGIHPPGDFIGKQQNVQSLSGRVFHVDGLVSGAITVTAGVADPVGLGFAVRPNQTAKVEFPPISTPGGLIYPIDTIIR